MPDISRLVIEVDSTGVVKANGDLAAFEAMSNKVGKSTDAMAKNFGAFQLIVNKLPGPLKSVASGLLGMVSPAQAAVSAIIEVIGAINKFSKESIAAFQEQEVNLARLGVVLEATGAQSWTTSEELRNMAVALRTETGRSADEIMQMQSVLLGFTGITGENFERLVGNMINMADVMGGSLTSSANIFGKALENPSASLNSLTRQGFVFTEEQKRMVRQLEEAGRLQEAQVIYLEAMENAFGKAAVATKEARGESINYALAIEDLRLAFGRLASESGFTQFIQGNIARAVEWYAGIVGGIAEMSNNRRINNAAIAAFDAGVATNEQALIALHFKIEETAERYERLSLITERTSELNRQTDRAMLEWSRLVNQYDEIAEAIRREREEQAEITRLLGIQRELSTEIAKIENAYDDTEEGKTTRAEREIAKWTRLRDQMWETSTGVFEGLSEEHKRQIDVIIADLQRQRNGAGRVSAVYADWVKLLSQATGYSVELVNSLRGLGTIEKYTTEVNKLIDYMNDMPTLYEALGLDETGVLENATEKLRSVLSAMVESGLWNRNDESLQTLLRELNEMENRAKDKRGEKYLTDLTEQINDASRSTYELALKRLVIEEGISREAAIQALEMKKELDYILNGYDIMGEIATVIDDALRSIRGGYGGYGQYAGGKFAEAGMNLIQGSDVGNFVEGTAMGGPLVGLIDMLVGALSNVIGGMEGIDIILSPITNMLKELEPTIKALMLPVMFVAKLMEALGKAINWLLNFLTFGLINQMAELYDTLLSTNDERKKEEERLKALNDQYAKLYAALKIQEEYYLQQRRHLNAEWAIENYQNVNDMILSPHGVFRTDPKDYIIATKNPETLMSGVSSPVFITVENHGAKVSTEESTDANGARRIKVIVDAAVQQGFMDGSYDNAFDTMSMRRNGKRVT